MHAPKSTPENLSPPSDGREPTSENNRFLRALERAALDYGPTQTRVLHFSRLRLRRGIRLYPRDREALKRMVAEQPEQDRRTLNDVLDDQLRTARWAAWRVIVDYGLVLDLPGDQLNKLEDSFAATALSLILESDRTSARRAKYDIPPKGAGVGDEPEPPDARVSRESEAFAELHRRVRAAATEKQKAQIRRVLAVLRKRPDLTYEQACDVAGLTPDQRKKLTRLRHRLI